MTSTGIAAPPDTHTRSVEQSKPWRPGWPSSAEYIVGTPSNTVTRSRWTISSALPGSNLGISVRQPPERHGVAVDPEQAGGDRRVAPEVVVGELRALRRPGGARRIEDDRGVLGIALDHLEGALRAPEQCLEVPRLDQQAVGVGPVAAGVRGIGEL